MTYTLTRDRELKERAMRVIPGGMYGHESTMLLPEGFPQFFSRAEGCHLWDADGNRYIDYMCAYGPNLLGYRQAAVEAAALAQSQQCDVTTGPGPVMVDLAEQLVAQVSHADWAMFCKNGSDATTACLTIARAFTGRRKILVAAHAYHGALPWCTPRHAGTLDEDRAHLIFYEYNDAESLADAVKQAGDDLAGIIATPFRHDAFSDQELLSAEYARACRDACDAKGAVLIVDEVRCGFRLSRDLSWAESTGVQPDLSAWGKTLANGHSLSAILGNDRVREAATKIFITGSFWFGATAMAAGVKTLDLIRTTDYLERSIAMGQLLRDGLLQQAASHGFTLRQTGPVQMPQILFEEDADFRTGFAWAQECVTRGAYLHPWHNMFLNGAFTEGDIRETLAVTDIAFEKVKTRRDSLEPHPVVMALLSGDL